MANSKPIPLSPAVQWVGVNDVESRLFEGLWDIPEGVSYNSYLVQGSEKTALIDSVHKNYAEEHIEKISSLTDITKLDYIVINHMEPDHTGSIPTLLEKAPNAKVVFTPIAQTIFKKYFHMDPSMVLVKGDTVQVSLGDKTLKFLQTPWLHWPETMTTYLPEEKILFSCDTFGAFRKLPDNFMVETESASMEQHIKDSKKYFASVFNTEREWVLKAVEKFKQLNLQIDGVAPSHGPAYTGVNAQEIMKKWASWSSERYTKTVAIVYGSMYGMTEDCVAALSEGVEDAGGTPLPFNLSECLYVDALSAVVEAPALIVGSPTYEHEIFPKTQDFVNLLKTKKFTNRCVGVFGSFSWSGEATRALATELSALGFELVEQPLSVFGNPTKEDLEKARHLGKAVAEKAFAKYGLK